MKSKKCTGSYALSLLLVLGLKLYSDRAGPGDLLWILRPTAWWTGILSRAAFEYEPGAGYVNHSLRFIIAPECAGLKFLMIAFLMQSCSFVHRMDSRKKRLCWTLLSLPSSCLAAIFVNGIRISLSILLPPFLSEKPGIAAALTSGQLHTAIGTAVYFLSLLVLYQAGDHISQKIAQKKKEGSIQNMFLPILWYLGPVLGLPFLSRIAYRDYKNFSGYELPVLAVCGTILLLFTLPILCKKLLLKQPTAK